MQPMELGTSEEEGSTAYAVSNVSATDCTAVIMDLSDHDYATVLPKHLRNYQSHRR